MWGVKKRKTVKKEGNRSNWGCKGGTGILLENVTIVLEKT